MGFLPRACKPWLIVNNINDLDIRFLKKNGIKALAFDKDNTLTKPFEDRLHPPLEQAYSRLIKNFDCIIVSNSVGYERYDPMGIFAKKVQDNLGIAVLKHSLRKPFGSLELIKRLNYSPDMIAIVGDRFFTDVMYAKFGGMKSILCKEIITDKGDEFWATVHVEKYLDQIVPPILSCFSDQDSRVRYYACESLYNVSKVARGRILLYFNPIFDSLSKLSTDSESSVKNGAELLDRLIKDIVSEKSLYSSSSSLKSLENVPESLMVPGTIPGSNMRFFDLKIFIPLLVERIKVIAPATRIFLVTWISVLESVPDLELVGYLPEFLNGLFGYLSDPNPDVRTATLTVLGEFLKDIKEILIFQKNRGFWDNASNNSLKRLSIDVLPQVSQKDIEARRDNDDTSTASEDDPSSSIVDVTSSNYYSGQAITFDFGRMTEILLPHISSQDEEKQATALRWINEFILMARERMLPFIPMILNGVLPCLSHSIQAIMTIAAEANTNLFRLVYEFTDISDDNDVFRLNVEETSKVLMKRFQDVHEETRLSSLNWLIMLHKNAPKQVMSSDMSMVSILLSSLNDQSEEVVKKDLELLAQISHTSDTKYFTDFMFNLLRLFSIDRRLLESRGSLIIRQLSDSLDCEKMFRTFAELLEKEEDIEFASIMVQNLNIILITSPELSDLRKSVKQLNSPGGLRLFKTLYKSWSHNPVALLSLCLLSSAYEHAAELLPIFAELEMNVALLIQIDKLVQLIESPVFTYLRLQLLEPDNYPHLFKCLYGILMLLPQSSAFATLRNRLNSVNSLITLHMTPGVFSSSNAQKSVPKNQIRQSTNSDSDLSWSELRGHFRRVQERHESSRKNTHFSDKSKLRTYENAFAFDNKSSTSINKTESVRKSYLASVIRQ